MSRTLDVPIRTAAGSCMGVTASPHVSRTSIYLRLGRVTNLPTVWTNALTGVVLGGGAVEFPSFMGLLVSLSLFYVGGMYLNDAFDREIDTRERPERPIPSGQISVRRVFVVGFGMLGGAILLLGILATHPESIAGWRSIASGIALAVLITYYDVVHKRDRLSPLVMGVCRMLVYVTASLVVTGGVHWRVAVGALMLLSYLIGLTYVAKQETLAEYRNLWPLLFLFAPCLYTVGVAFDSAGGAAFWVGFLVWTGYGVSFLVRRGRGNIPRAVIAFIAGISLLDALLIVAAGATQYAVCAVIGFIVTLGGQRWIKGT